MGQTFLSAKFAAFFPADKNVCPTVVRNAGQFAIEDFQQAAERASAAAHAVSVGVRHHKHFAHVAQQLKPAVHLKLRSIGGGLDGIRGGKDQVVPRFGHHTSSITCSANKER